MSRTATVSGITVGEGHPLCLIAGPCVIESRDLTLKIAERLRDIASRIGMPLIFKASFDKANRSAIDSYRGPGLEEGLDVLAAVRNATGLPVTSDIHDPAQAASAADVLDVLQVPAFLCRQTDLLIAAAKTGKPVNVKKGQFMAPWDMKNVVGKLAASGCDQVLLTDRGVSFGYNTLVSDMRAIPMMQSLGCPVVYDATHSVQQPGGLGNASGGQREMVRPLALAAVAAGCDALFIETHPTPDQAMSDAAGMLPLDDLPELIEKALAIRAAL